MLIHMRATAHEDIDATLARACRCMCVYPYCRHYASACQLLRHYAALILFFNTDITRACYHAPLISDIERYYGLIAFAMLPRRREREFSPRVAA